MKRVIRIVIGVCLLSSGVYAEFFYLGVLQKETQYREQSLLSRVKLTQLEKSVEDAWRHGMAVTDISHAPRRWSVVLSSDTDIEEQVIMRRRLMGDFRKGVQHYLRQGYEVVNVENGVGEWVALLQKGGSFHGTQMAIFRSLEKKEKQKWIIV